MNPTTPQPTPPAGVEHLADQQTQVLTNLSTAVTQVTGEQHQVIPATATSVLPIDADPSLSPDHSLEMKKDLSHKLHDLWYRIVGKKVGTTHSQQGLDVMQEKLEKIHPDSTITRE